MSKWAAQYTLSIPRQQLEYSFHGINNARNRLGGIVEFAVEVAADLDLEELFAQGRRPVAREGEHLLHFGPDGVKLESHVGSVGFHFPAAAQADGVADEVELAEISSGRLSN